MPSFPVNANPPFPLARLPRELVDAVFSQYLSMGNPVKCLIPFLTASPAWFDLACPHVWTDVCLNAIAWKGFDTKRRQAYAKMIRRIRDDEDCRCRRCMVDVPAFRRPSGGLFTIRAPRGLSDADLAVLQSLTFERLHTLEFSKDELTTPELLRTLRQISKSTKKFETLRIKCWKEEESAITSQNSRISLVDVICGFEGDAKHLKVEKVDADYIEMSNRSTCYWGSLISAELFSGPESVRSEDDIDDDEFPDPETCFKAIGLISRAPKLERLCAVIPEDAGSLVCPDGCQCEQSADVKGGGPAFPALKRLSVTIQSHLTLRNLHKITTLTRLHVRFNPFDVEKGIIDILPQMTRLTHLELLGSRENPLGRSWCSEFTVADVATAIQGMEKLKLFRFTFPAYGFPNNNHSNAAHRLLLSVATHNRQLIELDLGFAVPMPPPRWWPRLTGCHSSQLEILTTETSKSYEDQDENLDTPVKPVARKSKRLLRVFPKLRTFISEDGAVRRNFAR